jgi:hypothetical protein
MCGNPSLSENYSIFPNPSDGMFVLQVPETLAEHPYTVHVYNTIGQSVATNNGTNQTMMFLDLRSLASGVYHIVVSVDSKSTWSGKVLKY